MNNNQLRKTRILMPIITSIFALFIIGGLIYLFANKRINTPLFVFGLIVALIAPVLSFFSNVFIGRYTDKRYKEFEEETQKMVKYAATLKGYSTVDLSKAKVLNLEIEEINVLDKIPLKYNQDEVILNKMTVKGPMITFGVTICGLTFDNEGYINNITGFLPKSTWNHRFLNIPTGIKAKIKVTNIDLVNRTIYKAVSNSETYFDKKNNIVCIGKPYINKQDTIINLFENVAVVLNDDNFKAIYIGLDHEEN